MKSLSHPRMLQFGLEALEEQDAFDILELNLPECNLSNMEMDKMMQSINSYEGKLMETWDNKDVLNFLQEEIANLGISYDFHNLNKFECISGFIFKSLTKHQCVHLARCEYLGTVIFDIKEKFAEVQTQPSQYVLPLEDYSDEFYMEREPPRRASSLHKTSSDTITRVQCCCQYPERGLYTNLAPMPKAGETLHQSINIINKRTA